LRQQVWQRCHLALGCWLPWLPVVDPPVHLLSALTEGIDLAEGWAAAAGVV
jgi:hypothetical protein